MEANVGPFQSTHSKSAEAAIQCNGSHSALPATAYVDPTSTRLAILRPGRVNLLARLRASAHLRPPMPALQLQATSQRLRRAPEISLSLSLSLSPELLIRRAPCRRRAAKSVESMASLSSVDGMQSSPSEIWIETLHLLYPPSLSACEGRSD
ncbi:hypothetical protein NL676_012846 [Syzygium grande]|nr:hypothetical protein NL676_012846 [Syzygium grande]